MAESIQKAEKIIERFGGIRPMAAKMGVPVTTVQGWKKRDAIPDNRIEEIVAVAQTNNIDLSDLLSVPVAVEQDLHPVDTGGQTVDGSGGDTLEIQSVIELLENGGNSKPSVFAGVGESASAPAASAQPSKFVADKAQGSPSRPAVSGSGAQPGRASKDIEVRAIKTSSLVSIALILLVAMGSASYLWPMLREHNARITEVETQVEDLQGDLNEVRNDQKEVIEGTPLNWSEQLAEIQRQAQEAKDMAQATLGTAVKEVSKVSGEIMEGGVGGAYKKAQQFDHYVTEMTAESPTLQGFVDMLDSLLDEQKGRKTIGDASKALSAAFTSETGEARGSAEDAIEAARQSDPAAAAVFEGVPTEDLKAAGVMLSLSQLRDSLAQEGKPFDEDLGLLKNMVGNDDPQLRQAIEAAEPKAKEGVFSSGALAGMFDSLSNKVVDTSLKGDDVSLVEQASATFNNLVQVEKDGELVTGTQTQATLSKAKKLLAQGDVRGARAVVDTLPDNEKGQLQDWIDKADATIQVQDLTATLDRSLSSVIGMDDFLSSYYITRQGKSLR